jgi:hypothetical protein
MTNQRGPDCNAVVKLQAFLYDAANPTAMPVAIASKSSDAPMSFAARPLNGRYFAASAAIRKTMLHASSTFCGPVRFFIIKRYRFGEDEVCSAGPDCTRDSGFSEKRKGAGPPYKVMTFLIVSSCAARNECAEPPRL